MTKTAVLGVVKKSSVVAVLPRTIDIAFQNDRLHVVEQQALGNTAERDERLLMALDQGTDFHVANKFDVAGPAVAQGRTEGVERVPPFAKFDPVHLHLLTRIRFDSDHRIGRKRWSNSPQKGAQLAHASFVATLNNLPVKYRRRNPVRMSRRLPFAQVIGVRSDLAGPLLLTLVDR